MINPETSVMQRIRLAVCQGAVRLYRNNCGKFETKEGRWVEYGVGNPGGSDLIGYRTIAITKAMVGKKIAQFAALEVKTPGGYTAPARLEAQTNFLKQIISAGGVGGFVHSPEEAKEILDAAI